MLTLDDFPLMPRVSLLKEQIPLRATASNQTSLAVLVGLLANPAAGPKSIDTLASLTQYSSKRLVRILYQLVHPTTGNPIVSEVPLPTGRVAYHIVRRDLYTWGSAENQQGVEADRRLLSRLLTDIRRRARAKQGARNGGEVGVEAVLPTGENEDHYPNALELEAEHAEEARHQLHHMHQPEQLHHPEQQYPDMQQQADMQPPEAQQPGEQLAQSPHTVDDECNRLVKRFDEMFRQYQHALSTKQHLDELEHTAVDAPAGQFEHLRQEVLSEPFGNLQTMLHEAGQMIADGLGTTCPPIVTPCGVCFEMMYNPHAFPACGHTFCETCVYRLPWRTFPDGDIGKDCPMCRAPSMPVLLYL